MKAKRNERDKKKILSKRVGHTMGVNDRLYKVRSKPEMLKAEGRRVSRIKVRLMDMDTHVTKTAYFQRVGEEWATFPSSW